VDRPAAGIKRVQSKACPGSDRSDRGARTPYLLASGVRRRQRGDGRYGAKVREDNTTPSHGSREIRSLRLGSFDDVMIRVLN
jgi:hypothetical protein